MLVLKRRVNERVVIDGGAIVVEVVETGRGWCRLGVTAAPSIAVDREEIHHKKAAQKQAKEEHDEPIVD